MPPGIPRQNRAYGRVLLITSWIMRIGGGVAAGVAAHEPLTIYSTASQPGYSGPAPGIVVIVSIAVMLLGLLVLGAGVKLGGQARRHLVRVITSAADLGSRPFVLYLRPFQQDLAASGIAPSAEVTPDMQVLRSGRTHEERLARMFRQFGPMVTVGRPGEALPAGSGACRFYLPQREWQEPVRELIDRAQVILLGAGPGAGTIWEYAEVLRRGRLHRLVVLVTDPGWYGRFRALVWQPPVLPDLPPPRRPRGEAFYFRAMVYFGPGWAASLAVFDRSAVDSLGPNKYIKKRLKPVLAHLRTAAAIDPAAIPPIATAPGPPPRTAPPRTAPPQTEPPPAAPPPAGRTTFTNMPRPLTLVLIRTVWVAGLIGGVVGSVFIGATFGFGDALIAILVYCVLGFLGTSITLGRVMRWRTLELDSKGFAVTVATFRENRQPAAQARWDQVVRVGPYGPPDRPFACARITDAGLNPSRLVRLGPAGSPDFPVDEILAAIRRYSPTVAIENDRMRL
jgi:hypothetical protein